MSFKDWNVKVEHVQLDNLHISKKANDFNISLAFSFLYSYLLNDNI